MATKILRMKQIALITFLTFLFVGNYGWSQRTEFKVTLETPNNDSIFFGYQYAILSIEDSSMITGDIIEENPFIFKHYQRHFLLQIYSTEYADTIIEIDVPKGTKEHEIPTVKLRSNELAEVTVKVSRPMFRKSIRGMEVNVANTPLEKLDNAFQILKASPKVISPDDEQLMVIGKGVPKIFVDKQEVTSNDELKAMPAEMIDKIDIITNPSAKYAAEGTSAVIEIYTSGFHLEGSRTNIGINGGVNTQGMPNLGGNIGMNMKRKKFSMNFDLSGRVNRSNSIYNNEYIYANEQRTSEGAGSGTNYFAYGNIKLKYEFNDKHALTFSTRGWGGGNKSTSETDGSFFNEDTLTSTFDKNNESTYGWLNLNAGLRYKWKTDTLGSYFTTRIGYRKRFNGGENENRTLYTDPIFSNQNFNRRTENRDRPDIGTIEVDYVHQFDTTGWELATGISYSMLYNGTFYNQYNLINDQWIEDVAFTNSYDYTEQIGGVYIETTKEWDHFGLSFGLRGESTFIKGKSKSLNQTFIDTAYFNLFPNANLMFFFDNDMDLTLSYSTEFDRPRFANYDPFVRQSDSLNIEYGNPLLRPEYGHEVGLEWGIWKGLSFDVYYSHYTRPISDLTYVDETTGIVHNTSQNGNLSQSIEASINWPTRLSFWSGYHSFWFEYNKTSFTSEFDRLPFFGIGFGAYIYEHFDIPKDFFVNTSLQINRNTWGGNLQSQTVYNWNIGAGKKFLDGDMTLQLRVDNIIPRKYRNNTVGSNFSSSSFWQNQFTQFNVSLRYKFGRLKAVSQIQDVGGSSQGGRL